MHPTGEFIQHLICVPARLCQTASRAIPAVLGLLLATGVPSLLMAQDRSVTAVDAASYGPIIAPDGLASLFGEGFGTSPIQATLQPDGSLPTNLGGVEVELDGKKAGLIYVSDTQINIHVPPSVAIGIVPVLVRASSGQTSQGVVNVRTVAPAFFSANASGKGAAAAQNGVTYAGGPFSRTTEENPGDDKRTRITVYGTGIRHGASSPEGKIRALAIDPEGRYFQIPVEYAGPTPGFFGLDQINLVVKKDLAAIATNFYRSRRKLRSLLGDATAAGEAGPRISAERSRRT